MKSIWKPARKATPEVIQAIIEDLALGLTRAQACAAAGISEDSLARWEKRPEFEGLRARTEATRIKFLLQKIADCEMYAGDWKRWSWFLEKRFPEQFGQGILMAQQNNFFLDDNKSRELSDRARRLLDSE